MGYKKVCLKCRLVFNRPFDPGYDLPDSCPSWQVKMKLYPNRFRPPAKTKLRKWAVVRFLAEQGFNYQKILIEAGVYSRERYHRTFCALPGNYEGR